MVNCIGALVRWRDGDTSVIWIVDIDFCNRNNKNSKAASNKSEHKRYCNAWKWGLGFVLSLVQSLNNANIIGSYNHPSKCDEESLQSSYLAENIRINCLLGTKPPQSYSFRSIYSRVRTKIIAKQIQIHNTQSNTKNLKECPKFSTGETNTRTCINPYA